MGSEYLFHTLWNSKLFSYNERIIREKNIISKKKIIISFDSLQDAFIHKKTHKELKYSLKKSNT